MLHPKMTVPQISRPEPTTTESPHLVVFTSLLHETAGTMARMPTRMNPACPWAASLSRRPATAGEDPRPPALRQLGHCPLALHRSNARTLRARRDSPSPVAQDRI